MGDKLQALHMLKNPQMDPVMECKKNNSTDGWKKHLDEIWNSVALTWLAYDEIS
jgi:hypothetical protein